MKSKIFSYLAAIAVAFSVSLAVTAQDDGVSVYVCGTNTNRQAVYWKDGTEVALTDNADNALGKSIFVSGNDVYVAGSYTYWEGNYSNVNACYWKNGSQIPLTTYALWDGGMSYNFDPAFTSSAAAIYVSGGNAYVAGYRPAGGYWKNGEWTDLNLSKANSIYVFENDVYVAGDAGGQAAYCKNGQLVVLDSPNDPGSSANAYGIFVTQAGQDVTAIKNIDNASFHACFINNTLKIESPNAELINIYSITGSLLYSGKKNEGAFEIPFSPIQGVYIIKGSASGTIKITK